MKEVTCSVSAHGAVKPLTTQVIFTPNNPPPTPNPTPHPPPSSSTVKCQPDSTATFILKYGQS